MRFVINFETVRNGLVYIILEIIKKETIIVLTKNIFSIFIGVRVKRKKPLFNLFAMVTNGSYILLIVV